ncbi:MAG TPA: hypothetical protein PKC24_10500 [Cyclobacteriaceae bacterium]|nr:hypothetical protein [Cyclobacteriaceae bacterium]
MDEVVKQYLGTSAYIAEANATDEYVLCYTENKSQLNSMASIKFAVYHKASNNLVFKGNIRDGYIKWINDFELEQFDPPGLAEDGKTENDYKKVINVKTYKK